MTSLHKIHQLRCRYAQEIQQQASGRGRSSARLCNSLLVSRHRPPAVPQLDQRSREAQEILQLKLQRFFDSLPALSPRETGRRHHADSWASPDALPPRGRSPRSRGSGTVAAALRRPTSIADQLNTNSSVAQVSNTPTAAGDENTTLSGALTSSSLDITVVSDITTRDGSASPLPRQQQCPSAMNVQAQPPCPQQHEPPPPKLLSQSRARSSSLANLLDKSSQQRRSASSGFVDHMRLLLDDFHAATTMSAALLVKKQQQHQPPPATAPPQPPPPRRSRTGRCGHGQEVRACASNSGGGDPWSRRGNQVGHLRPRPVRTLRSASVGCRSEEPAGRSVCQVFQVINVDAVRSTLVTKDDRRVVKILSQFDCKAELIDTVKMSPTRAVAMVCVTAPNLEHLQWCIGRIENIFPDWELKCQMRGYRGKAS